MIWVYIEIIFFLLQLILILALTILSALEKLPVKPWTCYKDGDIEYCE